MTTAQPVSKLNQYVQSLTDDQLDILCNDYESYLKASIIGDSLLRYSVEHYAGTNNIGMFSFHSVVKDFMLDVYRRQVFTLKQKIQSLN